MRKIIIGTTPNIQYTFPTVNPSDIATAVVTIMKDGAIVLEKDLSTATVGDSTLTWPLSQSETLALGTGKAQIMLNYVLSNGKRCASREVTLIGIDNHITEVMT